MTRFWSKVLTLSFLIAAAILAGAANAQTARNCAPRDTVMSSLSDRFGEVVVSRGISTNGLLVEMVAAKTGDTWSIVATTPGGITCLLAEGTDFHTLNDPPAAKGDDT